MHACIHPAYIPHTYFLHTCLHKVVLAYPASGVLLVFSFSFSLGLGLDYLAGLDWTGLDWTGLGWAGRALRAVCVAHEYFSEGGPGGGGVMEGLDWTG